MKRRAVTGSLGCVRGFSLIEAMVALTILSAGLLTLASTTTGSIRRSALSAIDVATWSDVGRLTDSLTALGWGGVASGSETHTTHSIAWNVSSPAANLDRVDVLVNRRGALGNGTRQDTVVLLLSRAVP